MGSLERAEISRVKGKIDGVLTMKYYCVKQHDTTDCGAACLATIAKQNGYQLSISKIREVAGTDKQLKRVTSCMRFLARN